MYKKSIVKADYKYSNDADAMTFEYYLGHGPNGHRFTANRHEALPMNKTQIDESITYYTNQGYHRYRFCVEEIKD